MTKETEVHLRQKFDKGKIVFMGNMINVGRNNPKLFSTGS